ncbi:MAG: hypothetical protein ACOYMG_19665 [Candidatus Methylumidiphilus sp.]
MAYNSLPKVVQDCHNLMIWLLPLLDNFPRNRRFTLGERLESGLLEILELLVEAAYVKNKRDLLKRANSRLEVGRNKPASAGVSGKPKAQMPETVVARPLRLRSGWRLSLLRLLL